jgi:LmbE family N-acetylglucosaminyl deacetylase
VFTALVICPHADDAAAFCGGTVAKLAAAGWRMVLVRVTDDARDSVGVATVEETHSPQHRGAADRGAAAGCGRSDRTRLSN